MPLLVSTTNSTHLLWALNPITLSSLYFFLTKKLKELKNRLKQNLSFIPIATHFIFACFNVCTCQFFHFLVHKEILDPQTHITCIHKLPQGLI
mmetsp:Transcript_2058/g.4482  ORF Transcript_2058/g.4482 Transcript_2058/m.4482 type:complete len:93 (+) Transcript_2058:30-308(+)